MTRAKKTIIGWTILILLLAAVWAARPAYHRFKETRALRQAHAFLKSGNLRDAFFSLRLALTLNSTNAEAMSLMADILSDVNSPNALALRQRAAELAPTEENKLLLASTAVQFERPPFPIATQTLAELQSSASTNISWHVISSRLALRRNQVDEAEAQIQAAARLQPTNRFFQLDLAVIHLQSGGDKAVQARQQLAALADNPATSGPALRSLITDCLVNRQFANAKQFSDRVLALPTATFADRLQHLTILSELNSPDTPAHVAAIKSEASTNVLYSVQTADWLLNHQTSKQTRDWILSLPRDIRETFPMPVATLETYTKTNDWSGLEKWLIDERWANQDFLRFAWLARSTRQQNDAEMSRIYWHRAISAAEDTSGACTTLAELAATWGWSEEAEEALRALVKRDPKQSWAWQALLQQRTAAGDTAGLVQLYSAMLQSVTNSLVIKNNLAALELLLNRDTNQAFQFAKEVYQSNTNSPEFVSTEAFALYRQNKAAQALQVMQTLPQDQLSRPEIALYYGLLLVANGQHPAAEPYLAAANKAHLLPEEQQLYNKASSMK